MVAVVGRVNLPCERAPSTEIGVLPVGSFTDNPVAHNRIMKTEWFYR
jgi:hypothetical protein